MIIVLLLIMTVVALTLYSRTDVGRKLDLWILSLVSASAAVMFVVDALFAVLEGEDIAELLIHVSLKAVVTALSPIIVWVLFLAFKKTSFINALGRPSS